METQRTTSMEAQTIISVVGRRWKLIAGVVAMAAIVAVGLSLLQEERYRATTDLLLSRPLETGELTESGRANEVQVLESRQLADAVEQELGFEADISVELVADSDVVQLTATHEEATTAATIADSYAAVYLDQRRERSLDELAERRTEIQSRYDAVSQQLDDLTTQLNELDSQIAAAETEAGREQLEAQRERLADDIDPQRQSLIGQQATYAQELNDLRLQQSTLDTNTGEIISPAVVPDAPYQPAPIRNGASAVVVASVLAVGLAFLRERLDDSLSTSEDVRALTGLPSLGAVPDLGDQWPVLVEGRERPQSRSLAQRLRHASARVELPDKVQQAADRLGVGSGGTVDASSLTKALVEAFRKIRTSVNFAAFDQPIDSLAVTSAVSGEGKTTTSLGLASMLAAEGRDVVLVECDLRRPTLTERLDLPVRPGLAEVLVGQETLEQAMATARTRITEWVGSSDTADERQRDFSVLVAGSSPPNAAELLGSHAMRQLVEKLVAQYDMVILDVPPLLAVTDGLVLSGLVDGVVLVTSRKVSKGADVDAAVDSLSTNHARVIGTVFNRADRAPAYYG